MIHLCSLNPFSGHDEIVLSGKGPSYDPSYRRDELTVGVNEAGLGRWCDLAIAHDWTVVARVPESVRFELPWAVPAVEMPWIVSAVAWNRPECSWVRNWHNYYFNGRLVWGIDVESKSVPGRMLGVGTATVALQLAHQAGVKRVVLNGFDNFWGDDNPGYHAVFKEMGCDPADYAEVFPASGTVAEQRALVRESMQYVIERGELDVLKA